MRIATDTTFADEVLLSEKPVLIDFWATWCGRCKMLMPVLEEIAVMHSDKITIVQIDADANPETMTNLGVLSLPTLVLFRGGKEVKRIVGAKSRIDLLRELDDVL